MATPDGPEPDAAMHEPLPLDLVDLHPLLDRLTAAGYPPSLAADRWSAIRAANGADNAVYRATTPGRPAVALEFATADERDRAGRGHRALSALVGAGLDVAPRPLALRHGRADPVRVATWIEGEVRSDPPQSDTGWARLVAHYGDIHHVPGRGLPRAVSTMTGAEDGRAVVRAEMVRRGGRWRSVDWENAGWGDPAFELSDLLGHPTCLDLPAGRRRAVRDPYAAAHPGDTMLLERAAVYDAMWACWWACRFARMEAEMNAGTSAPRLLPWRPDPDRVRARGRAYLARAREVLG